MAMMMTKCNVCGGFYNAANEGQCPYCNENKASTQADSLKEHTVPIWDVPEVKNEQMVWMPEQKDSGKEEFKTEEIKKEEAQKEEPKKTETLNKEPAKSEPVKTVDEPAKKTEKAEFDSRYPVAGWAVVTKGEQLGRDYRIHSENNFIGSSDRMDIQIVGDDMISENHALIVYDPVETAFYLSLTEGKGIVRINDRVLLQPTKLKSHDRITIGNTELTFVAFCGEHFAWN